MLYRALDAAKILEEKYGLSVEIIDARTIVPFNYDKVLESVKKQEGLLSPVMHVKGAHTLKILPKPLVNLLLTIWMLHLSW